MKRLVVPMVLLLAAALLAAAQQQSASAAQMGWFAAAAYNDHDEVTWVGDAGWEAGGQTPLQAWRIARHEAMDRCEQAKTSAEGKCRRAVWVYNGYLAVANAPNKAWGSGAGEFRSEAVDAAVQSCTHHGGKGCRVELVTSSRSVDPGQGTQGGPWHVPPDVGQITGGS